MLSEAFAAALDGGGVGDGGDALEDAGRGQDGDGFGSFVQSEQVYSIYFKKGLSGISQ